MAAMQTAEGKKKATMVILGGRIIDTFTGTIRRADIAIIEQRIARVGNVNDLIGKGTEIILTTSIISPGFGDWHHHTDDSLLIPTIHSRLAIVHGTTLFMEDPHEIGNAAGFNAVLEYIRDCHESLVRRFINIPTSVPSVPGLETTPAITPKNAEELIEESWVRGGAELMNDAGVMDGTDTNALGIVQVVLRHGKRVDGHFSNCEGIRIQSYRALGVSTDHQSSTPKKIAEILESGVWAILNGGRIIQKVKDKKGRVREINIFSEVIRRGMSTRHCMLCSDDRHPIYASRDGIGDYNVRQAVKALMKLGFDRKTALILAVQMATINGAECYGLENDFGSISPGKFADLVEIKDIRTVKIGKVILGGELVADNGKLLVKIPVHKYPEWLRNTVKIRRGFIINDLHVKATKGVIATKARVIQGWGVDTKYDSVQRLKVVNGCVVPDTDKDIVKIAVLERHGINGKIGVGFVHGTGLGSGAIATSLAHDSHNLTVIGTNDIDIHQAVMEIVKMHGGMVIVENGKILAKLALPIAGLMTDNLKESLKGQAKLLAVAKRLGLRPPVFLRFFFTTFGINAYPGKGTEEKPLLTITDIGLVEYPTRKVLDVMVG